MQRIGRNLPHDGLDALADCRRPNIDRDRAVGLDLHAGVLARTRATAFDKTGDTDAMIAAVDQSPVQAHFFGPAELRNAAVECARIVAAVALGLAEAVIRHDRREPIWHLGRRDEIAATDVEAIEAEVAGCKVEEPLAKESAFVAARPPECSGRRLVADHGMRSKPQMRHAVRPGEELRHIAHRRRAVGPHIGPDVDEDVAANAANGAVAFERNLDVAIGLARMGDGYEMLAAVLHPFDRVTVPTCRERAQEILRIKFAARAEPAAD